MLPSTIERTCASDFVHNLMPLFDLWLRGKGLCVDALHEALTSGTTTLIATTVTMITTVEAHTHHHTPLARVSRVHKERRAFGEIVWTDTRTLLVS